MTHSAFFITLCEHGDAAGSCFPDHSPKVGHSSRERTLCGYELVWTQITLKGMKIRDGEAQTQTQEISTNLITAQKIQFPLPGAVTH